MISSYFCLVGVVVFVVDFEDDWEGYGLVDGCKDGVVNVVIFGIDDEDLDFGYVFGVVEVDCCVSEFVCLCDFLYFGYEFFVG